MLSKGQKTVAPHGILDHSREENYFLWILRNAIRDTQDTQIRNHREIRKRGFRIDCGCLCS